MSDEKIERMRHSRHARKDERLWVVIDNNDRVSTDVFYDDQPIIPKCSPAVFWTRKDAEEWMKWKKDRYRDTYREFRIKPRVVSVNFAGI